MICPKCGYNTEAVDKSIYWQRNPRYKGIKLGNSTLSFQNYGCFTVCLAYLVKKDPLEVHEKLKKGGAYSGALIISEKAAKVLGLKYFGIERNINNMPNWTPSIKEVQLGKSQHFVVRITNGKKMIWDPWLGKELPLNYYKFKSYRNFK
jgi:hypothetical protein